MASQLQSDKAYSEIRRRILILEIRPEDRLKEEEWAGKLTVGRLAVREALTRLHGEGLVERGEKGGFFAAGMEPKDVIEIREVREILEVAAIRLARERISSEEIAEMETTCDDFAYMVRKGYHTGAWEADRRFHDLLVAASGNRRLLRAYEHCHIPLFQIRVGQSKEYIEDYEQTEQEHRAIVAALKVGKIDEAVDALRRHLTRGTNIVLEPNPEKAATP
ncbi:MAG: GntR family transcriptional regulator [Opitutaceae bacterium]|nr:GntR family transcriptional regulator [Opitutaceae bacterium]